MTQEQIATPGAGRRLLIRLFGPGTWRNALSWAVLILALLGVRWALIDQFTIPTGSMEPTLHGDPRWFRGDRVSVNKWIYGLRWPLNQWRIPFTRMTLDYADERLWRGAPPQRWEIVVFKSVEPESRGETLIKRVVGLPGEQVRIGEDGRIEINGEPLDPPPELAGVLHYTRAPTPLDDYYLAAAWALSGTVPGTDAPGDPVYLRLKEDIEELGRKLRERGLTQPAENQLRVLCRHFAETSWGLIRVIKDLEAQDQGLFRYGILEGADFTQVPAGHYYLLGDNSAQSRDSRAFGWVPLEHILGRAFAIWWPPSRWRDLTGFTQTWWGQALALLYGLPLFFLVYELVRFYGVSLHRVQADWPAAGLGKGDWVVAQRWPFGARIPFSLVRFIPGRPPRKGETVVYIEPAHPGFKGRLLLGHIAAGPGEALPNEKETHTAVIPAGSYGILGASGQPDSRTFGAVEKRYIIGRIRTGL